ncbi:hypothetical protein [Methylobacterium nodulans]|uniref:Uncharacterized protein n=1 Tax=Methylobacterium nodulans (strain LMG 21967 / CNCM I-2342 / ORS 2060) TaxID=460265 RepID=B8IMJ6_METNO|nr:hypothetical protein [Methylobacterium nodulans]ACL58382.1 hypothetical protein Mnod_3471 [Methylobacterium nodulans ORS 2060]
MPAMNAHCMLTAIAATLAEGEQVEVRVTYARGRTFVVHYRLTRNSISQTGRSWNGHGTLRAEYARRVVASRKLAKAA